MKYRIDKQDLLDKLGALGFPLFETEEAEDANAALAGMVKSKDLRLWEGFPVVLANSAEREFLNYETVRQSLKKASDRANLGSLAAMSLALYKTLNLKFSWADKLYGFLSGGDKKKYAGFLGKLKKGKDLKVAQYVMSNQRLKSVFNNYFTGVRPGLNELLSVKDELGLEYALSQVFSPKQKELFFKKLKREKLTKTEKEYYSRVVRKKVVALANPDLHRLSQKLL